MSVYLSYLVPAGALALYPLDNSSGSVVSDESGNARDMTAMPPGIDFPQITANQINGRKAVVHNDNTDIFRYTGALTVKDMIIVGKADYTSTFPPGYTGLFTGLAAGNLGVLTGNPTTTKWTDTGIGFTYRKSGVSYVAGNMQAPFNNFELMQLTLSGGMSLDGLQFGRDRADTDRLFQGKWALAGFWGRVLTSMETAKLKLFADLRYGLWLNDGTTLTFPSPDLTGIAYSSFWATPQFEGFNDTTDQHEYADAGESFNRATDTPPREWTVSFDCVGSFHADSKLQTDVFDAFAFAVGIDRPFSFTDKYGVTHTNVRIAKGGYSRTHDAQKSWTQKVSFKLRKTPG